MTHFVPTHLPHLGEKYYRRGKKIPKTFYRITIKALIQNEEWKILLLKEGRYADKNSPYYRNDAWLYDLPGGGLEWGEDFRSGLMREIMEEMGLRKKDIEITPEPEYVYITELDDRYHDDALRDDFYPVCMFIYKTKLAHYNFHTSSDCTRYEWVDISDFEKYPIWTHSAYLATVWKGK